MPERIFILILDGVNTKSVCIFNTHNLSGDSTMQSGQSTSNAKKRTNLSISESLLREAKSLQINISQSAEKGIAEAIRLHKQNSWLQENAEAIASSNDFVNEKGLPLDKFRMF